jgi:hypothetical protein
MTRAHGNLMVWDWERFAHGAPVGQDAVHYAFMAWLRQRKRPPAEAGQHVLQTAPPVLEAIGADPSQAELLLMLHQLEMGVRFAEARAAGVTVRHDLFADGLHRMLAWPGSTSTIEGNVGVSIHNLWTLAPIFAAVIATIGVAALLARGDELQSRRRYR